MPHLLRLRIARVGILFMCLVLLSATTLAAVPGAQSGSGKNVYLPLVMYRYAPTVFGIEMSRVSSESGLELVLTSGTRWIRRGVALWKEVEPVEGGGYKWDAPAIQQLDQELIVASQHNLKVIVVARNSPKWATAPYEADCAPINPAKYANFAAFMAAAVARYSAPPFNVQYWEIGNEPDADIFPNDSVFGCWGVINDPYYGGRAYGAMLKQVAAAMKAVNPNIKILNGGLLLFQPYTPGNPATTAGRFLEGMFVAGAGNSFDMLSFHSYIYYDSSSSTPLGPSTDWRVNYLKGLMQAYNIPIKPLLRTETALLCPNVTPECRWAQADYVGRTFAWAMRDGLLANLWYVYDNDSYHNAALIEPGDVFVPRPAYFAYRHVATLLSRATYVGPLENVPPPIEGYRFKRAYDQVIAYWSDVPRNFVVAAPPGATVSCTDRDGGEVPCTIVNGQVILTAQRSPGYIVIQ